MFNGQVPPPEIVKIQLQSSARGIALIIVMLVILVLAALAGAFAFSMKVESTLARNSDFDSEMEWMGRSGVEYAKWVLAQQANCPNEPFEALSQAWAGGTGGACASNGPLAGIERQIQLGNGSITWTITDQERKFNINLADYAVLQQALTIMGVDASLTPGISDAVLDWVDRDEDNHLSGAESEYYLSLNPPYVSKNGPMDDVSELLLLKGVFENPEIYWGSASTNHPVSAFQARTSDRPFADPNQPSYPVGLVDIFTTLSSGKININTATLTTLQMIPGINDSMAAGILQRRSGLDGVEGTEDDFPFQNIRELRDVPGMEGDVTQLARYCDVRSYTFDVQVQVEVNGVTRSYFAVVRRGGRPGDFTIIKFYWK